MKLCTVTIAVALAGVAGTALAGNTTPTQPVTESSVVAECLRPGQPANSACDGLYARIDSAFSPRQIMTIKAWNASHPQFLFTRIESMHQRFDAVLRHYVAQQNTPAARTRVGEMFTGRGSHPARHAGST